MKKETVNTFTKGMVKDLHPLTTPNNVLTDALNATLITYNGNELILQNDMGNAEIGTAKLPSGYVPVAMKEHGGIVYVAAWNPIDKKGQIGTFPSPQQLYESEPWSVNGDGNDNLAQASIQTSNFYNGFCIQNEVLKQLLFRDTSGNYKVFHPGDKYVITMDEDVLTRIRQYTESNKIKLQLGVIKKDGGIEIIADFTEDEFIIPKIKNNNNEEITIKEYIEGYTRVFNGSSSGSLILIVTIITFDSFNLVREYNRDINGNLSVTFTGEATRDGIIYKTNPNASVVNLEDNQLYLYTQNANHQVYNEIIKEQGNTSRYEYSIWPALSYGYIGRLKQSGVIDFNKVKKNNSDFSQWRFYVNKDYIRIGWAFDYYNLDKNKTIDHIEMRFYDFFSPPGDYQEETEEYSEFEYEGTGSVQLYTLGIGEFEYESSSGQVQLYNVGSSQFEYESNSGQTQLYNLTSSRRAIMRVRSTSSSGTILVDTISLYKEHYSGNFEDYIRFENSELEYGKIYIVDIVAIFTNGDESHITSKMLYCSSLYNDSYNNLVDKDGVQTFDKKTIYASIDYTTETNIQQEDPLIDIYLQPSEGNNITNLAENKNLNSIKTSNYIVEGSSQDNEFITRIKAKTNLNTKVYLKYKGIDNIIGTPDQNPMLTIANRLQNNVEGVLDRSNLAWSGNSNILYTNLEPTDSLTISTSIVNNQLEINSTVNEVRYIQGKQSETLTVPYDTYTLTPLYNADGGEEDKNRVFSAYITKNARIIAIEKEGFQFANLNGYTEDIVLSGSELAGGVDDAGLNSAVSQMNSTYVSTVNIAGGGDSEYSHVMWRHEDPLIGTIRRHKYILSEAGWDFEDYDDIDVRNYLAAVWKFDDYKSRIVNLFSYKQYTKGNLKGKDLDYPRLDVMLKCFLSQMFIPQKIKKAYPYITTLDSKYRYYTGNSTLNITVNTASEDLDLNFKHNLQSLNNIWQVWKNNWKNTQVINEQSSSQVVTAKLTDNDNLIPTVKLRFNDDNLVISKQLDTKFYLESLLSYYMGVTKNSFSVNSEFNIQDVYYPKSSGLNTGYTILEEGAFKWDNIPELSELNSSINNANVPLRLRNWKNTIDGWKFVYPLHKMFTTTAELDNWTELSDNNELLAKAALSEGIQKGQRVGKWFIGKNKDAPDLYYRHMLSNYSLFLRYKSDPEADASSFTEYIPQE